MKTQLEAAEAKKAWQAASRKASEAAQKARNAAWEADKAAKAAEAAGEVWQAAKAEEKYHQEIIVKPAKRLLDALLKAKAAKGNEGKRANRSRVLLREPEKIK